MSSKTMAEKENSSSEPPSLIPSLPEDTIIDILARVSRWEYPRLSLVSKQFRSLVALPELYARRSLLGCTEHCPYIVVYEGEYELNCWYIICQKANGNRSLVHIPSLPPLTSNESFVAVGSKIYVFGGGIAKTSAYSIDCKSHKVQPLPSMPVPMSYTKAAIIEDKIYVMGSLGVVQNLIVLFNTKTHTWEPEKIEPDIEVHGEHKRLDVYWCMEVVMGDKFYMRPDRQTLVYDAKENIWRPDDMLRSIKLPTACVIDDMLYYYPRYDDTDDYFYDVTHIKTYDLKRRCWGVVKGLKKLFSKMKKLWCTDTADYGGNLALFYSKDDISYRRGRDVKSKEEIWCAEISLERRQGEETWGKVEWCGQVLVGDRVVLNCLNVMV